MFQPQRLVFARRRRQVTQTDLARSVDVVPKTIQRYEGGKEVPRLEVLTRMAAALRFPVEFFEDARPLAEVAAPALSFRGRTKLKSSLKDNAVAVAQLVVDIEAFLVEHFELPVLDVPDMHEYASSPGQAAGILRTEWTLGMGPIANMVHLLEAHGVRVFSLAEDVADVDAFCFRQDDRAFVVLNLGKTGERGRFDAAHELAHLVLHRQVDFVGKDVEADANQFASEFLVPRESLLAQLPAMITIDTVLKLKKFWKVSAMAMTRRLKDVGRLSDWVYRTMCMELARRGYRTGEGHDGIERESSSLLRDMIRGDEGLPVAEIARELRVHSADILPLIFRVSPGLVGASGIEGARPAHATPQTPLPPTRGATLRLVP